MSIRYYEVEISFLSPAGAVVPITAQNEEEAAQFAQELFHDYKDLKVNSVKEITDNQPTTPMMLN